jgi:hypothetical protein
MRFLIALLISAILLVSFSNAQERTLPMKEIHQVASEALVTFSELVNEQNFEAMGFESVAELHDASLGEPLQTYMVRLDKLQEYQPQDDPNAMLDTVYQVIYPVMVEEKVRSSIAVGKLNEEWQATSFGGPNKIKMLADVRKDNSDSTGLSISSYFIVQVPSLNLYFIGYQANGQLMLTPILDDLSFGFIKGVTMTADKAFAKILPAAKKHDGLPR